MDISVRPACTDLPIVNDRATIGHLSPVTAAEDLFRGLFPASSGPLRARPCPAPRRPLRNLVRFTTSRHCSWRDFAIPSARAAGAHAEAAEISSVATVVPSSSPLARYLLSNYLHHSHWGTPLIKDVRSGTKSRQPNTLNTPHTTIIKYDGLRRICSKSRIRIIPIYPPLE